MKKAKIPMLFIHGSKDKLVPTLMAQKLHHACGAEYKDILIVEGADYTMSYREGKDEYKNGAGSFVDKFYSRLNERRILLCLIWNLFLIF